MTPLPRRLLPNTDLEVSAFCYGTAEFGTAITGDAADRLIGQFVDAGGNFFDTAHCYAFWVENGLGASERELGASLRRRGCQDTVIIATKGGHPDGGASYPRPADFLSERMIASDITESLERLGIEQIPLYYLHRDDGQTPVEEIVETLNREIARGRIRYLGASNWSVSRIAAANAYATQNNLHGFVISQVQGSLAEPDLRPTADPTMRFAAAEEMEWHAASQVPLALYSATAGGFFAGRGHEKGSYASALNRARFERARELSVRLGCTPTQVALSYLLHQEAMVIPLFSTGNPAHLAEALGAAAAAITLDAEQVRWLRDG